MGFHTFDAEGADRLEEAERRYRYLSAEELLWAIDPTPRETVLDLGSGTGFYTDDVAPAAGTVYALDVQPAMHEYYGAKGIPENVSLIVGRVADLPFADGALDAAFSTMTYHEFARTAALQEVARVLQPGGRFVVADWAATGSGEVGPPPAERYTAGEARTAVAGAGFEVQHVAVRPETFLLVADVE
ncbi:MAG: class I SAM-dependent methyltransferase [Halobacteriaceae archaeon]